MLTLAEETDDQEDRLDGKDIRGNVLLAELARRETGLARIKEAKRALEQEANNQKHDDPSQRPAGSDLPKGRNTPSNPPAEHST